MHKVTHAACVWGRGLSLGNLYEKGKVLQNCWLCFSRWHSSLDVTETSAASDTTDNVLLEIYLFHVTQKNPNFSKY